jgi:transcriptional regulator
MYNPAAFRETDPAVLQEAIAAYPLATLVTIGARGLDATQLPMLYRDGVLRGHVARANPQWQEYTTGTEALAIFTGPQHYITPNWYASKREHGRVVPTWNYVAVHARGTLTLHEDPAWLLSFVTALTDEHERTSAAPWKVSDAPAEYIEGQLRAIVGVEMAIASLEGKWKLSQNRPEADIQGVVEGLGGDAMAEMMKRRR